MPPISMKYGKSEMVAIDDFPGRLAQREQVWHAAQRAMRWLRRFYTPARRATTGAIASIYSSPTTK